MYMNFKFSSYVTKSIQICFGNFRELQRIILIEKKHFLNKIWANLAIFSFRIQDTRNCSKSWILKDFREIEKSSKRSSYRPVDHFLRSSMLPKVFTTIPGQLPKHWEAMAIHVLETYSSSLTPTYKQNTAKNSIKIEFWRIFTIHTLTCIELYFAYTWVSTLNWKLPKYG